MKLLTDLSRVAEGDVPDAAALASLRARERDYDTAILAAARRLWDTADTSSEKNADPGAHVRSSLAALLPNDVLLEPIMFKSGKLLLAAGARISAVQIERLRNLRTLEPIAEPISVSRAAELH